MRNSWAVYPHDRRTPIVVSGNLSKKQAIKKALKIKKRGSNKINKVRRLTDSEQRLADQGKWVKGHNIDKERKKLRGKGPKPKAFFSRIAVKEDTKLWEESKKKAVERMGGRWSARAAQYATDLYKKAGGRYKGSKSKNNSLAKWTKEDWGYSSPKSRGKGRYRPAKIWAKLSKKEIEALNRSKYRANAKGLQYAPIPKKLRAKANARL